MSSKHTFSLYNDQIHHLSENEHHVYDMVFEKWSTVVPENRLGRQRDFYFDSCFLNEKLYVFGVVKTSTSPKHLPVQTFCLKTNTWSERSVKINCKPKASMRCKCVVVDKKIFLFELEGEFHLGMFRTKINRVLVYQPEKEDETEEILTDRENEILFKFAYMPNLFAVGSKVWFVSRSVRKKCDDVTRNVLLAVVYDVILNKFFEKSVDVPPNFFGVNQMACYQNHVYVVHSSQGKIFRFIYENDELRYDYSFSQNIGYSYTMFRSVFSNE